MAALVRRLLRLEKQVVKNKTQVRLARTVVSQGHTTGLRGQLLQQLFNELVEVVNLLEFSPRILVELAFTGQNVQLFEQFKRLPRSDFGCQCDWRKVSGAAR